jgi:hypothetical protein
MQHRYQRSLSEISNPAVWLSPRFNAAIGQVMLCQQREEIITEEGLRLLRKRKNKSPNPNEMVAISSNTLMVYRYSA